jgi:hypothetical protein
MVESKDITIFREVAVPSCVAPRRSAPDGTMLGKLSI